MNFATLPPEINSGRIFAGPGSGPMIQAATAWDKLAARLYARLVDYRSVTSKLAGAWPEAATPYIDWLDATATRAALAAVQAKTAASAFESALATAVAPALIEANRAQRILLASTNCLGQLSPAIADIEAEYDRMWERDAAAMNAYAAASADAAMVIPFSSPAATAGTSAPEVMSAGQQVMSAIPEALQAFSFSPLTNRRCVPCGGNIAAVETEFTDRTLGLRADAPELPQQGGGTADGGGVAVTVDEAVRYRGLRSGGVIGTLSVPQAWAPAAPPLAAAFQPGWFCEPIHLVHAGEPPS
jgi:PPE family